MTQKAKHEGSIIFGIVEGASEINKAFWLTCLHAFTKPQQVLNDYFENKGTYLNPYRFTFLLISAYIVIASFLEVDLTGAFQSEEVVDEELKRVFQIVDSSQAFLIFLSLIPAASVMSKLFSGETYYSSRTCYVIALYTHGAVYLPSIIFLVPLMYLFKHNILVSLFSLLTYSYILWVYKLYFGKAWGETLWKSVVSFLVNIVVYSLLVACIIFGLGIYQGIQSGLESKQKIKSVPVIENEQEAHLTTRWLFLQ